MVYGELLKSIKRVTDLLEGENYATVNLVIPAIIEMEAELSSVSRSKSF